jgi:surfactin synthase thioesterase subunit
MHPRPPPLEPKCWPLSSGQLRTWFIEQFAAGTAPNNLSFGVRLIGTLDTAALRLSAKTVVDRHEALRTTFDVRDGEPVQCVHQVLPPLWVFIDLTTHTTSDPEQEAFAVACREVYKPFDLRKGPLVRLVLLRVHPQTHILLVALHHIICDGRSLELFASELAACYAAFCRRATPELDPSILHYTDYACWQREWLASRQFEHHLGFWTEKLAGARLFLDLSIEGIRPTEQSFAGSSQARKLPKQLVEQLRSVVRRYNVTPFALSLAVFQILLCHYSGERDILVGIPVAARGSLELESVIGLFANLVVVRADLAGNPRFPDFLGQVRNEILDALTNQHVPFEKVVNALHPARSLAHNPIFQVLFTSVRPIRWKNFGELEASSYIVATTATPFDLSASLIEDSPDTWWLRIDYRTDLFTSDHIARMLDQYVQLLSSIADHSEVRLSELHRPSHWPATSRTRSRSTTTASGAGPSDLTTKHPSGARYDRAEEVLANLWAKVLGTRPPTTNSNFFDLGGHSLMATHLAFEIGRTYGREFPVSCIFQRPTIDAMARYLRAEIGGTSSVVPIQEKGSLPPFFCGGRDGGREFRELSRFIGSDLPFFQFDAFAVQEQRLLAGEPLYNSVPDLAAAFRRDILSIRPNGPYFLGGMCEGGILALEIALQLQDQGLEVALLAQFDTPVNGYFRRNPFNWAQRIWYLICSGQLPSRMLSKLNRPDPSNPLEERYMLISTAIWNAIYAYRPNRVFHGEITLFRGVPNPALFNNVEDVAIGWNRRASLGIQVHDVTGEHSHLFSDPNSQRVIASVFEKAYRGCVAR